MELTKVQAIANVLRDNGGVGSWRYIYDNIEKYYPAAKAAKDWEAGIRGVLYREITAGKTFKKVGLGVFALLDYQEEKEVKEIEESPVRWHSYIEGLLVEIGNHEKYETFCADPTAIFRPGVPVNDLTTIKEFPEFTYTEITSIAKRVDVMWFPKEGYRLPLMAIEVVDSIGTLTSSLQRLYQLKDFRTGLRIVCPTAHAAKVQATLTHEPYCRLGAQITVKTYEEIAEYHKNLLNLRSKDF